MATLRSKSLLLAILLLGWMSAGASDIYLGLTAHGQRMDIGIAGFTSPQEKIEDARVGRLIQDILRNDMLLSRYFNIIEGGPLYTGNPDELADWENRGANVLVCGSVKFQGRKLSLTAQLLDIGSRQVIWEKTLQADSDEYRLLAHRLNDEIVVRFTGERGIATTTIAFVYVAQGAKNIYLVDYDGYNQRPLTDDRTINTLPSWSPDGKEIVYTTYRYANPDLYAYLIDTGKRRAVSRRQGLNTAASYAPDGSVIALTLSRQNNSDIYLITPQGNEIKRLTRNRSIETSPSFAPNGKEVVYISDFPGYPQLYIMGIDGGKQRRLLAEKGFCDSPAWSPRGDKIVFTMRQEGYGYDLFLYDLASNKTIRLTQEKGNEENPTFSPDGRFVVFSSEQAGKSALYSLAIDGSGMRKVTDLPGGCVAPAWSPFLYEPKAE